MKSLLSAALLLSVPALAAPFDIDTAHSGATFAVKHMMISTVRGTLGPVTGSVDVDDKDVTKSKIDVTVDVKGISTGEPKRDEHLRSGEFFESEKYPTIKFVSKKIEKAGGDDKLKITGDLTMHGVTKEVVLDAQISKEVKDPFGMQRRAAAATTKVNRSDFGLKYNKALETGGVMIGDEVQVNIDVAMTKRAEKKKT
jgi:polyisoprenoid-binding protein YceI